MVIQKQRDGGDISYAPATVVATWPKGSFVENITVDQAGMIFVRLHTDETVVRVDPATGAHAYISVTGSDTIYRAPLAGEVAGPRAVCAERLRADDFAIDTAGALYIAIHPARSLVRLAADGSRTMIAAAMALPALSQATELWMTCLALAVAGGTTLIQFATYNAAAVTFGAMAIGSLACGSITDLFSIEAALLLGALGFLASGLAGRVVGLPAPTIGEAV